MKRGEPYGPHQAVLDKQRDEDRPSPYDVECAGTLYVVADDGHRPVELECDTCLADLTIAQRYLGTRPPRQADDPLAPKSEQDPLA